MQRRDDLDNDKIIVSKHVPTNEKTSRPIS